MTGADAAPGGTEPPTKRTLVSPATIGLPAALVTVPWQVLLMAGPSSKMPGGMSSAKLVLVAVAATLLVMIKPSVAVAPASMVVGVKFLLTKISACTQAGNANMSKQNAANTAAFPAICAPRRNLGVKVIRGTCGLEQVQAIA